MSRIEVAGTFLFEKGEASFSFEDREYSFSDIQSPEQLRAVLVAIAQFGAEASVKAVLEGPSDEPKEEDKTKPTSPAKVLQQATDKVSEVLSKAERSFQEHQTRTAEALGQAEKDYEAATADALRAIS